MKRIERLIAQRDAALEKARRLQNELNSLREQPSGNALIAYEAAIVQWRDVSSVAKQLNRTPTTVNLAVRSVFRRQHPEAHEKLVKIAGNRIYLWMLRLYEHKQLFPSNRGSEGWSRLPQNQLLRTLRANGITTRG